MTDAANGYELSVTRYIAAPPSKVWRAFTERLEDWWCPKPWTSKIIEFDLRPGGRSCIEMRGPEGEVHAEEGVILEVIPERKVVFTDAFAKGWIPKKPFILGIFSFEPEGEGTRYRGIARHWDEAAMKRHQEMGFEQGWSAVADQLAEVAENI